MFRVKSVLSLRCQPAFGVEGRHAAGAGGRDRLPVVVVRHVARGKDPFHARLRAKVFLPDDVMLCVEFYLTVEKGCVGRVANREKETCCFECCLLRGIDRAHEPHAGHSLGVVAEIVFFFYQAPLFRRFGVKNLMIASLAIGVLRFLMIGFGAQSLVLLLIAQVLHAATFGVHHSASVATLQRWFSGALQARGQALFISISYGLGGSLGGLLLSACWDTFGAQLVYLIAAAMSLAGLAAALLSYHWQHLDEESK